VILTLQRSEVRSWRTTDLDPLVRYADNRGIWINLRDRFPYPYRHGDGRRFIRAAR
jgi:ribosomal-protein-alanine N-acetyltransferase